jgi:hypothetical protein
LTNMKILSPAGKLTVCVIALFVFAAGLNCAATGLLSERYSEDFHKVSPLLPGQPIKANSTFVVYGDNQASWRAQERFLRKSNWTNRRMLIFPFYQLYLVGNGMIGSINRLRNSPDFGAKQRAAVRDAVYVEAKRSEAAFILNLGDITAYDGRRPAHWASFLKENKIEHPLLNEIPYLPAIGNHEHANDTTLGLPNYQAIFGYPRFYVVEFTDAALFVLDSNFIIDQYDHIDDDIQDQLFAQWFVSDVDNKKLAWLEEQLVNCDKPFKMVAMHHPPITYAKHYKDWTNSSCGRDLLRKRKLLLDLFQDHGVDVVFSGHDHLYQHNLLRYGSDQEIHFVVSGGGGGPLRDVVGSKAEQKLQRNFQKEDLDISAVKRKKVHHYCVVEVNHDRLTVRAFELAEDPAEPTRLIEEIVINKG